MRLVASRGGGEARFGIQRMGEPQLAIVKTEAPEEDRERTVRLAGGGEPEMLAEELETPGRDQAYEEALAMVGALLSA